MSVTLSYCVREPITIQYPDRIPKPVPEMLPKGYRGLLEVDVGVCIGCMVCMRTCPIGCIRLNVDTDKQTKTRYLTRFDIDLSKCMDCGLCCEPCPTGALRHSTEFEGATLNVINLVLRFVKPGDRIVVYKVQKDVEPPTVPQNEPLRKTRKAWNAPADLPPDAVRGKVGWKSSQEGEGNP